MHKKLIAFVFLFFFSSAHAGGFGMVISESPHQYKTVGFYDDFVNHQPLSSEAKQELRLILKGEKSINDIKSDKVFNEILDWYESKNF